MRNLLLRRVNLPAGLRSQGSKAIYQRPSSLRLAGVRSLIGHACPPVGCLRSDSASPIKNGWPMPCWAAGPGRFSRLLMPPSSDLHAAMPTVWKSFAGSADTLNHGIKFLVGGPSPHGQRLYSGSKRKDREQDPKAVAYWYLASCALVFSTVVIGGLTRLTESGLSIVEWSVIKGMKAPSSAEEWEREFEKYKLYPEYQVLNHNMSVGEFKKIFYMEWLHRNLGRVVGITFVFPALYFGITGRLSKKLKITSFAITSLIGLQGLLGWLMVRTGLKEELRKPGEVPRVDAKWLSAHLGSALVIYSTLLYTAMDILRKKAGAPPFSAPKKVIVPFKRATVLTTGLIFITALSGALVAGLDAGLIYGEFPYMGGHIVPSDMWGLTTNPPAGKQPEKWWVNMYKNPTTVQFDHRLLGTTTTLVTTAMWLYARKLPLPRQVVHATALLPLFALVQASLGVTALLYHVPICVATIHQSGSLVLLSLSLWLLNCIKRLR